MLLCHNQCFMSLSAPFLFQSYAKSFWFLFSSNQEVDGERFMNITISHIIIITNVSLRFVFRHPMYTSKNTKLIFSCVLAGVIYTNGRTTKHYYYVSSSLSQPLRMMSFLSCVHELNNFLRVKARGILIYIFHDDS